MTHDPKTGEIIDESLDGSEGRSLEDIDLDELDFSIKGTQKQMDLDLGTQYSVRQSTAKIPMLTRGVRGQFSEGDKVKVELEFEVEKITFARIYDRSGNVVGLERIHNCIWL